ncbi:hypothetical protein COLO4_32320 [Corchorus olitorius]|uniref:Uncharacterized protein n=1 Tax=Corchorus olitorius TaxID=93759 RepID=A0A1R3GZX4_9ROSI|nr:hypothetical protein COLO4_32320 [Corchorus olitorius]
MPKSTITAANTPTATDPAATNLFKFKTALFSAGPGASAGVSEIEVGLVTGDGEDDGGDATVAGDGGVAVGVFDGDGTDAFGGEETGVGLDVGDFFGEGTGEGDGDCAITEQNSNAIVIKQSKRERAIAVNLKICREEIKAIENGEESRECM